MNKTLDECRWLYNYLLEQRKNAYESHNKSLSCYDQNLTFPKLKLERPSLNNLYSQTLQDISMRIDLAFKAFFRRVKAGEKPGYPRFKSWKRYDSFGYPQSGFKLKSNRLYLSKIGNVKLVFHRPIEGKIKTCTIKKSPTGKWYVYFSCEVESKILSPKPNQIGIDVGLKTFAHLSDNTLIENPRFFQKEQKALAKAQRKERKKVTARVHERIKFKRHNFTHQESRKIVNTFGYIFVEDLNINRMLHKSCLAKSISDASWSMFFDLLFYKAEEAGRIIHKVNPAYTSQTCSSCGHRQEMSLSNRQFNCPCCPLQLDRDYNASLNILRIGLDSLGIQSLEVSASAGK